MRSNEQRRCSTGPSVKQQAAAMNRLLARQQKRAAKVAAPTPSAGERDNG